MRKADVERKTKETQISLRLVLDGKGGCRAETGVGFLDHMLDLLARHGGFDLTVKAKGDIHVDDHHLVEDIGICLGQALKKGLGQKHSISRYGSARVPMDEALVLVVVDISGRSYLNFNVKFPQKKREKFNPQLLEEFMRSFANESRVTLHVNLLYGKNNHHIMEAIFKALGLALEQATRIDPRVRDVPSTKGKL